MDFKADLAPPIVVAMTTVSYLSVDITNPCILRTEGGFEETLLKALKIPLPSSPPNDRTAEFVSPLNLVLPFSPLGNRTNKTPKLRLHMVRHGQAIHNLRHLSYPEACNIFNPPLTNHGLAQCRQLRETFPDMKKITHILTSPLHRTLETTLQSFHPLLQGGHRAIAWDGLREFGASPCNEGYPKEVLEDLVKEFPIDTRLISKGWETCEKIMFNSGRDQYMDTVKKELYSLCYTLVRGGKWKGFKFEPFNGEGNIEILLVSHGTTLNQLTGKSFHNAQFRTFKFAGAKHMAQGLKKRDFVETSASRKRKHIRLLDVNPRSGIKPPSINVQGKIPPSTADVKGKGKAIDRDYTSENTDKDEHEMANLC